MPPNETQELQKKILYHHVNVVCMLWLPCLSSCYCGINTAKIIFYVLVVTNVTFALPTHIKFDLIFTNYTVENKITVCLVRV